MFANQPLLVICFGFFLSQQNLMAASCTGRSIYLNGVDISGSQHQELQKVDIIINEKGDIYITAPQYEVYEEDHYLPLSRYLKSSNTPEHRGLQQLRHNQDMRQGSQGPYDELPSSPSSEIPRASTLRGLSEQAEELKIPPPPNSQPGVIPPKVGAKSPAQ